MLDSLSVNSYSAVPYSNSYFMAAYQSPNANMYKNNANFAGQINTNDRQVTNVQSDALSSSVPFKGASDQITANDRQVTNVQSDTLSSSVPFKGASDQITANMQPQKKGNVAKWIITIASLTAIAYGGYKCHKLGTGEGIAKIWDGAKQYWNKGIDKISQWKFNIGGG